MSDDALADLLSRFARVHVLVLGDVMLDRFLYGTIERISPEAPIPVIAIERTADMPGGAANVARNCASLGAHVALVGVVGADAAAEQLRAQLAFTPTIDVRLTTDPSRPTTTKTRYVAEQQQMLRADAESRAALANEIAAQVLEEFTHALDGADVVLLSDYAKGVLSESVTATAIAAARAAGKPVIVDPKSARLAKYSGATVLTPNRAELQLAAGHECRNDEQIECAARRVLADGICAAVVVTRGRDGMTVAANGAATVHLHTVAREVFDVSGAGDTALATLALGVALGASIADCARLANVSAGIVVGKRGTAVATAGEVLASLDDLSAAAGAHKIFTLPRVLRQVQRWRACGERIAFTNGCFDLLHPGHLALLQQAKQTADKLVVGLNSDLSVRRLKGPGRPVQPEVARATLLSSLRDVDAVVIFPDDTPLSLIETLEPDVLVKGADYTVDAVVGAQSVMARGGRVVLVDLVAGESTSNIVQRLAPGRRP